MRPTISIRREMPRHRAKGEHRSAARSGVEVVILVGSACAIFLWEPWHGPVLLSLSTHHGIDAGDLPALPLLALAIIVIRRRYAHRRRLLASAVQVD
jgi:hypothetical protein